MTSVAAAEGRAEALASGLRLAMRRLASGLAIATAGGPGGPVGIAVTSLTSLSLDPPSVLLCVNQGASLHGCLAIGKRFGVTLLAADQADVASAFASLASPQLRFAMGDWSFDDDGVGALGGSQANLACVVDQLVAYGTHTIVIARVEAVEAEGAGAPLIYYDGRYH